MPAWSTIPTLQSGVSGFSHQMMEHGDHGFQASCLMTRPARRLPMPSMLLVRLPAHIPPSAC